MVEESLAAGPSTEQQLTRRKTMLAMSAANPVSGPPSRRYSRMNSDARQAKRDTFTESTARYYTPYTRQLSTAGRHRNFASGGQAGDCQSPRVMVDADELRRFSLVQVWSLDLPVRVLIVSFRLITLLYCSMETKTSPLA